MTDHHIDTLTDHHIDKRSEPRIEPEGYHCVEVQTLKTLFLYQFKIWNISASGMCLLVRSDSDFLDKVDVGEIIDIKYYPSDLSWPPDIHRTKIMHITRANMDKFKDHYMVGLMITK
ncbi:hypothetical protein MTBBW1_970022 [Desulfamplus magnetovallimortis]|uniref:PilZ domain-containing protein n=1 Tax=Desulfamplus magnetovallimortis TaxID=1246637 RepID=A0A1W1HLK3_9BACT|nr:hypothetical protein [Desulfamplus magnetovallimortis]SLM33242.1 hypothetical protein MTBBW1_970022 [Desulfamplus magnetovallimortis]